MLFIETPIFSRRVKELLEDDAYRLLQIKLMAAPESGDLIEGTGGLRKLRVAACGRGKRGGARVIYYYFTSHSQLAMLYIYPKNEQSELSSEQRKALKHIIENWRRT
ncbi:type II toxin-antitoxin system RelE/ParE family toxin [Pantoea sp. Tr-811]|uniref:type II toxin-antitoxin system RelE/ParE family toxin n=1 Tax=unclassified Pantoea TaxID=2630326 RepID=UPI00141DEB88|nr:MULTISPECIES: type II toxin-antitoxin system RelE/ParE family toxin [unclassified Pantoea]NIE75028.1 type II toxin-antitoxin system RelE/ParE family toxin [Pantoea sp. Ap-967]NIF25873.1 type II toxin-antitoxin system RelE/ParE family toxin [Pantoea sp. Tr-811]